MNDAAASIGFRLKLDRNNLPTDAGFAYELVPLAPGQQPVTPRHAAQLLQPRQQRPGRHLPRRRGVLQSPPPGQPTTPRGPTIRDDGSPYVRPQTELAPAGHSGRYVAEPDYSPLQGPISRQQFVDPRELIELTDADSVYMVLQPGSYAIDDQGNLHAHARPASARYAARPTGTAATRQRNMVPASTPYGWLAYNNPEGAFAAAYREVLGTPGEQSMTAVQGRLTRGDQSSLPPAQRNYGPGLTRTETVLRPGTAAELHADYSLDPTASMTPEKVASEATDWESGATSERTYTPTGTRQSAPWAGLEDYNEERALAMGWTIYTPQTDLRRGAATHRPGCPLHRYRHR